MKTDRGRDSRRRRGRWIAIGSLIVVFVSYGASVVLHHLALADIDAARGHIAHADWLAAISSLDRALREDPFAVDGRLLRASAIIEHVASVTPGTRGFTRADALGDLDWYLRSHPDSGKAHYLRGVALAGMARVEAAREELDRAIALLQDPTEALIARAEASVRVGEFDTAVKDITRAIERDPLDGSFYRARRIYRLFLSDQQGAAEDQIRADLLEDAEVTSAEDLEARVRGRFDDRPIAEKPPTSAAPAEIARLQGKWMIVALRTVSGPLDPTKGECSLTFDGERYRLVLHGRTLQEDRYWIDPTRHPHRIDWIADVRGRERRLLGLYEFRGDELLIVMANAGEPRPYGFKSTAAHLVESFTLRRAGAG